MGGGDKALRPMGGRTILDRVIERAAPQVEALVLNGNGDPARFAATGLPIAADTIEDFPGPLAGVLCGLDWTIANAPECTHVASFACDAPFLRLCTIGWPQPSGIRSVACHARGRPAPCGG